VKVLLRFCGGGELALADGRRLARVFLRDDPRREPPIARLGFDALREVPAPRRFAELLARRSGTLKGLLLDQTFAAGAGNWIADEVLYQARLDPRRSVASLTQEECERLRRKLQAVVRTAVRANAEKERLPRTWLFHHRWGRVDGAVTARGEPIEHLTVAGRTTAWVPSVQR
jgi:formamidopyrimidine-DNA glycosylase